MPILNVRHKTTYRYRRPVMIGPHTLMLRPRDSHDIRLIASDLTCSPAATLSWMHDVFGNSVASAAFTTPSQNLEITSNLALEICAPEWPIFAISAYALEYPFQYTEDEQIDLGALLSPQYSDPEKRLAQWARGFVRGPSTDTLSLLKDLNAGVSQQVRYRSRDDERTQGPLETLARGWGTCRDYAVLLAEAARNLCIGARLASGYLYDPQGALQGVQGSGSTHAWVEIYLPGAGWIAFDPTNRVVGGAHLIRVAVARNIQQVAPVTGSFLGVPDDMIGMDVSVSVTQKSI